MNRLLRIAARRKIIIPAASPGNDLAENDKATIHTSRFLGRVSVRQVVCQHSTCVQVSLTVDLYSPPGTFIKTCNCVLACK